MTGMLESLQKASTLELMGAILADKGFPAMPDPRTLLGEGSREQQMANLKAAVLMRIREAANLVSSKATPEEATAYKQRGREGGENFQGRRLSGLRRSARERCRTVISG